MNEETSNIEHPTPNVEVLSQERLSQFRGDVDSLRQRNQRFAQMLVEDFAALIRAAEDLEQLRRWYRNELDTGDDSLCNVRRLRAENEQLRARIANDEMLCQEALEIMRRTFPQEYAKAMASIGRGLTSAPTGKEDLSCQK